MPDPAGDVGHLELLNMTDACAHQFYQGWPSMPDAKVYGGRACGRPQAEHYFYKDFSYLELRLGHVYRFNVLPHLQKVPVKGGRDG